MTIACSACEVRVRSWIGLLEARDVESGGQRLDRRAVDHELAHQVHQRVEALGVDAHRAGGLVSARGRGRRLRCGLGGGLWLGRRRGDLADVELGDLDRRDLGDAAGGLADGVLVVIGRDPRVDLAAVELLEAVRGRTAARATSPCSLRPRKHHVRAHRRHQRVLVER